MVSVVTFKKVKIGRHRPVAIRKAVDVKDTAKSRTRFAGNLFSGVGRHGAFAENRRDLVFAHPVDHRLDLAGACPAGRR